MPSPDEPNPSAWMTSVLNTRTMSGQFEWEDERHNLHGLSEGQLASVLDHVIAILNGHPDHTCFLNCTTLVTDYLLQKEAPRAVPALKKYLRHPDERFRE